MKFYLTVAFVMFSIVSTTMLFGPEGTSVLSVSEVVCYLIDEFRGNKDHYEENGHVEERISVGEAYHIMDVSCSGDFIAFAHKFFNGKSLRPSCYDLLSLSNMKKKEHNHDELVERYWHDDNTRPKFFTDTFSKGVEMPSTIGTKGKSVILRFNFMFKEEEKEVGIFRNREKNSYMCSLDIPEGLGTFNVSEDGEAIVTGNKGHIRKWEFREGFKKGFEMFSIYPNGKIKVRIGKYVDPRFVTDPSAECKRITTVGNQRDVHLQSLQQNRQNQVLTVKLDYQENDQEDVNTGASVDTHYAHQENFNKDKSVTFCADEHNDKKRIVPAGAHPKINNKQRADSAVEDSIRKAIQRIVVAVIVIIFLKLCLNQAVSKWGNKAFAWRRVYS